MREVFQQSLADVQDRIVEISELVTAAIEKATHAFGKAMSRSRRRSSRPTP